MVELDEDRFFVNNCSDYSQGESFAVQQRNDGSVELPSAWADAINNCIKALLAKLDYGIGHDVDKGDVSVYTGTSGISLLFLHLYVEKRNPEYLKKAGLLLEGSLHRLAGKKVSFLCGDAGVLACSAWYYFLNHQLEEAKKCIHKLLKMHNDVADTSAHPDELLFGRCGYLYALLFIREKLGAEYVDASHIASIVNVIVKSGMHLAKHTRSSCPLMYMWHDNYYLGAAHGLSGIYFMLMKSFDVHSDESVTKLVEYSIDYLISLKFPSGNFPSSLRSRETDKLVHWCHGAPGFIHMLIKAYNIYGHQRYLDAASGCCEVIWQRGLLKVSHFCNNIRKFIKKSKKGYGICHGVAGNGYAFLAMYQLTKNIKYLYRAVKFAEWIFDYGKHGCRIADRPYSLFEGLAGTIYYLADLLNPLNAKFPAFH